MGSATAQEMAIAVLRHPAGPRQMGFPGAPRPGWLGRWIDVQHQLRDFLPVGAILGGVQQAQIGDEVLLVIAREDAVGWRRVCDKGIERWRMHQARIHQGRCPCSASVAAFKFERVMLAAQEQRAAR